jgi:hypothetical protein
MTVSLPYKYKGQSHSDPLMHLPRGNNLQEGGAASLAVGLSHIQFLKFFVLRWERALEFDLAFADFTFVNAMKTNDVNANLFHVFST